MAPVSLFKRAFAVLSALLAPISAQGVAFTNNDYTVTAGSSFLITWSGDGTPATITLMEGPSSSLQKVATITMTNESSYSWTPASSLAPTTYALSIYQSGYTNYSPQFTIEGAMGSNSSSNEPSPSTSTTVSPSVSQVTPTRLQLAQVAPTPTYVANGGLTSGNGTWPYYATANGTGVALPSGTSRLGQYAEFEGAAAKRNCGVWQGVIAAAALSALFA